MKISLITVVYNGENFLQECFNSVRAQTYADIEYIVIDGGSTDGTLEIIRENRSAIDYFVSEKDKGLYDALNKGIRNATGEVVGILNADDLFAAADVLAAVAKAFVDQPEIDGLYGDLNYIHPTTHHIIRTWKSKQHVHTDIKKGWMPAHPTLYLKRSLFEKNGGYSLTLGTAADYELTLRYFYTHNIEAIYLPILMVNMRMGGVSNNSLKNRIATFVDDYRAIRKNGVPYPLFVVMMKKLGKLSQF